MWKGAPRWWERTRGIHTTDGALLGDHCVGTVVDCSMPDYGFGVSTGSDLNSFVNRSPNPSFRYLNLVDSRAFVNFRNNIGQQGSHHIKWSPDSSAFLQEAERSPENPKQQQGVTVLEGPYSGDLLTKGSRLPSYLPNGGIVDNRTTRHQISLRFNSFDHTLGGLGGGQHALNVKYLFYHGKKISVIVERHGAFHSKVIDHLRAFSALSPSIVFSTCNIGDLQGNWCLYRLCVCMSI